MSLKSKSKGYNSIRSELELADLVFTSPQNEAIELIPGGAEISVTPNNLLEYISRSIDMMIGSGVQRQVNAMRAGFKEVHNT